MKQLSLAEFHAAITEQGAASKLDITLVCPLCEYHQTPRDLISAGAGATFDDVEKYFGFSCVGRWTGAQSPRTQPDGRPCNWTLGGLFRLHKLEVIVDGTAYPRFEVAESPKGQAA